MNIKIDKFLNYIFVGMTLIWGMIYHYLPFVGLGYIPLFLSIFCFFVNLFFNKKIINPPYVFWGLWVVLAIFNSYMKGSNIEGVFAFYLGLFRNFVVLYVASLEFRRDKQFFLKFISVCLFIYAFGSFYTLVDELGGGRFLAFEGNMTILSLMFLVAFGLLQYQYKSISFGMLLVYIVVALYFIIMGATRKAIGGVAIIMFMAILANLNLRSYKTVFFTIMSLGLIYCAFNYILDNTILGERFIEESKAIERYVPYQLRDNWFFQFVGDRSRYYVLGWKFFIDNLWMGIGLGNYALHDPFGHLLHTEYMVQLTECGIIGTTLYLLFMGWMAYNLLYVFFRIEKRETLIYAGMYGAILFISFTAWIYQFPIYFIVFGIIIGYCKDKRFKEKLYANRNLQKRRFVQ